jgi:hypothetical protein
LSFGSRSIQAFWDPVVTRAADGYWLISIIDFDRLAPVADAENVSLRITRLELSQRKALGNLKADANAATLMRGEEIGSSFSGQMVRRSHTCCENRFTTGSLTSGYEKSVLNENLERPAF